MIWLAEWLLHHVPDGFVVTTMNTTYDMHATKCITLVAVITAKVRTAFLQPVVPMHAMSCCFGNFYKCAEFYFIPFILHGQVMLGEILKHDI